MSSDDWFSGLETETEILKQKKKKLDKFFHKLEPLSKALRTLKPRTTHGRDSQSPVSATNIPSPNKLTFMDFLFEPEVPRGKPQLNRADRQPAFHLNERLCAESIELYTRVIKKYEYQENEWLCIGLHTLRTILDWMRNGRTNNAMHPPEIFSRLIEILLTQGSVIDGARARCCGIVEEEGPHPTELVQKVWLSCSSPNRRPRREILRARLWRSHAPRRQPHPLREKLIIAYCPNPLPRGSCPSTWTHRSTQRWRHFSTKRLIQTPKIMWIWAKRREMSMNLLTLVAQMRVKRQWEEECGARAGFGRTILD
ncbi:hypothetical protein QBC44DRAFT_313303 [Cladorrhinum sp. PSN332]|nr:hypothetical protein QBC44DRAFT_313303 [Cladorrhinum sp. PSN332]